MFDAKIHAVAANANLKFWYKTKAGKVSAYPIYSYSQVTEKTLMSKGKPMETTRTSMVLELGFKNQSGEVIRWAVKPERLVPLTKDEMALFGYEHTKDGWVWNQDLSNANAEARKTLLSAKQLESKVVQAEPVEEFEPEF